MRFWGYKMTRSLYLYALECVGRKGIRVRVATMVCAERARKSQKRARDDWVLEHIYFSYRESRWLRHLLLG